jgi:glyoxylase-like metal-dependent hydrolase (beta-lactamase superfamily II)
MIYNIKNITFSSNTYIIANDAKACLIIDPGLDESLTDACIQENNLRPIAVLCTHGHFDHIAQVSFFKEKYDIPFYIHEADVKTLRSANFFLKMARINFSIKTPEPDFLFLGKHETIQIADFTIRVFNYPGHSKGSCLLQIGSDLFSGDILYARGLGFNSFPDENKTLLRVSIKEIFSDFSDADMIYPGHGEACKLGEIKKQNLKLLEFLNEQTIMNE